MENNMKIKEVKEVRDRASAQIGTLLNKKPEGIISVTKEDEEWKVKAEVLERKAVPDTQDILSTYELKLTEDLELKEYRRHGLRRRGSMIIEQEA